MLSLSGIGFVLFVYGKKQDRWVHVGAGLALMVYPRTSRVVQMLLGGVLIGGAFWWALQAGW
jgi:hypothetical protein